MIMFILANCNQLEVAEIRYLLDVSIWWFLVQVKYFSQWHRQLIIWMKITWFLPQCFTSCWSLCQKILQLWRESGSFVHVIRQQVGRSKWKRLVSAYRRSPYCKNKFSDFLAASKSVWYFLSLWAIKIILQVIILMHVEWAIGHMIVQSLWKQTPEFHVHY